MSGGWWVGVQVDLLMAERKEANEAKQSEEAQQREAQAQSNAYLSLMPLAIAAPPMPSDIPQQGGFVPGYAPPPGYAPGYAPQPGF